MAKLTKKSYQRKAMVMGGIVFASCALFATGFAAFVVSSSASYGWNRNKQISKQYPQKWCSYTATTIACPTTSG